MYHKSKTKECFVCARQESLELHHNIPLSEVVKEYLKENNIKNPTNDTVLRDNILEACKHNIFGKENLITLCKTHHKNLHNIFGKTYTIKVSEKVKKYLMKQKEKLKNV